MQERRFLYKLIIIGFIVFIINNYFFQICFVHGISMEPTLKHGQAVIIKKIGLNIENNDIVLIKINDDIIIKRVVGIPGDKLIIKDNYLYVNNEKNDNFYIEEDGLLEKEIILKKDEYFVLGDNRQNSIDSRYEEIGIIQKDKIKGIVLRNKESLK